MGGSKWKPWKPFVLSSPDPPTWGGGGAFQEKHQGTPAPWASGTGGHLHPGSQGSGDACTLGLWDACTLGLWDRGTPAPRASGIRGMPVPRASGIGGHLHPGSQGSGDTCTPGLWDQDLPFMDDRPTGPAARAPITTDMVQLWSLHRSVPMLAGLGLGKPQKVREGDRNHAEVGITHTQFTE